MDPKTRVLYLQLQLAGLGLVVGILGWILERKPLVWVGAGILVLGAGRWLLLNTLLKNSQPVSSQDIEEYNLKNASQDQEDD